MNENEILEDTGNSRKIIELKIFFYFHRYSMEHCTNDQKNYTL